MFILSSGVVPQSKKLKALIRIKEWLYRVVGYNKLL
jgi:hypothetical protein